jgi:predicted nicotinamide N-methyase
MGAGQKAWRALTAQIREHGEWIGAEAAGAFILANTILQPPPHVPEIQLYLAGEALPLWQKTEDELAEAGLPLPYWAFAWAGGQALARYVLDTSGLVAGKRVAVFAAGAGLEAIAAVIRGAATVVATEIDPFARVALALNARANGVVFSVSDMDLLTGDLPDTDVLLLGDVFFEQPMSGHVADLAARFTAAGGLTLVGDPGRSYLPKDRMEFLAEYQVPTTRALEDALVKQTRVWRFVG